MRLGFGDLPSGSSWRQVYGVAILGGIGFTMSLFIGTLAFPDPAYAAPVRVGVLLGSFASAFAGYALLYWGAQTPSASAATGPSRTPFLD